MKKKVKVSCIDLFCGAGGMTHGFTLEKLHSVAGIDMEPDCRFPYEANNPPAKFINADVRKITPRIINNLFGNADIRILIGCAPCQPFSSLSAGKGIHALKSKKEKWGLLYEVARLIGSTLPEIVVMENVPNLKNTSVFQDFVKFLKHKNYHIWYKVIDSSHYGVPQKRKRIILLASQFTNISLIPPTTKDKPKTVWNAIGHLPVLAAGEQDKKDRLHVSSNLSTINLARIKASKPGGTWKDWPPKLRLDCQYTKNGIDRFATAYCRAEWDKPSATMTTSCTFFGSDGRFGHPEDDRALSLREASLLQSFPANYKFVEKNKAVKITSVSRMIGNAVPVLLGRAIAKSIKQHLVKCRKNGII